MDVDAHLRILSCELADRRMCVVSSFRPIESE